MDFEEFSGKTIEDAITEACTKFTVTSDRLDYEIIDKGSAGFLGLNSHPAIIKAKPIPEGETRKEQNNTEEKKEEKKADKETVKSGVTEKADRSAPEKEIKKDISDEEKKEIISKTDSFLADVFKAMEIEVNKKIEFDEYGTLSVNLEGPDMGVLIGKRGQTLDSLQYLVSLVVNKTKGGYIRVKVDTEDYRERRKKTLENLAKNLSYKVKRTRKPVTLEPMNPYERRVIHSTLQNDKFVTTHSEGEEPYRRVVITLKH
ncbi:MAG: protein jag [Lachnospiraceae bacterium]|nr:protein jag [Lachnospiraceae bacterium]